jgi:hypothetical protein
LEDHLAESISRWRFKPVKLFVIALLVSACCMSGNAHCQALSQEATSPLSLEEFAKAMPDCIEIKNECQVCARGADKQFHCSNVAIACSPNGEWKCTSKIGAAETKE